MEWSREAESKIRKVPFFVRKKVRKEVEKEACSQGAAMVSVLHLEACRHRYMSGRDHQTMGYEIDQCFGADDCPNRAVEFDDIYSRMQRVLETMKLDDFLKETIKGPVKMHHAFRVSISGCPNCCSRPQIVDFGLAGAAEVVVTHEECTGCGICFKTCRENSLCPDGDRPVLDDKLCLHCGDCAAACPSGTLAVVRRGFRVMLGGKLGRHPALAMELPGIWDHDQVLDMLGRTVMHFKRYNRGGERLGDIISRTGMDFIAV